jgi:hypothetical protein
MPGGLQFDLILPDGSKSLVPADWTDFRKAAQRSAAFSAETVDRRLLEVGVFQGRMWDFDPN